LVNTVSTRKSDVSHSGRSFGRFAAACLYKAGREQGVWVTHRDIAKSGNVTPTTAWTHHQRFDELAV